MQDTITHLCVCMCVRDIFTPVSVRQFSTYNRHLRRKLKAYESDSVCTVYRSPIIQEPKVVSPWFQKQKSVFTIQRITTIQAPKVVSSCVCGGGGE